MPQTQPRFFALWFFVGCALIAAVIYLSLTSKSIPLPDVAMADKVGHLLAYAALMGWFGQLYTRKYELIGFAIIFCILGVSLEYLQRMGGHRMFEYGDMLSDALGVLLGWLLTRTIFSGSLPWVERQLGLGD